MAKATKTFPYIVAIRVKGNGKPENSEGLTRHKTIEAANNVARKINRTGSDVAVYHYDF